MRAPMIVVLIAAFSGSVSAEIVSTTDGRKIELNADGTYRVIEESANSEIKLTEQQPFFQPHAGEYGQNSIRFMPIFKNETDKSVVGFKFRSEFKSAFGDQIFSFDGESSELITPGNISTAATFYYFEDNQFISNEPYDKLQVFEASGTGAISTKVTAVAFEGGEVIKLGE